MTQQVQVAVAVIQDLAGRVLLTQRASHKHQGGLWEFPGGKCESGETPQQALVREIHEELNIRVTASQPLIYVPYQYPELKVLLKVFRVTAFQGEPCGAEGQPLRWVPTGQLDSIPLPPANRPIVRAIQLPEQYLITPDLADAGLLYQGILAAAARGIRLTQLRAATLQPAAYRQLASRLLQRLPDGTQLLLKGSLNEILSHPGAGWHLSSTQLAALAGQARPLPEQRLLAASCHNREELQLAAALGCDFVTLSPVQPTASHPDRSALGWQHTQQLVQAAQLPVYFLGGMTAHDAGQVRDCGGQGIAAIRGLWPL